MPFQPINFANIEPQGNPALRDLAKNLLESFKLGMQLKQIPEEAEREKGRYEIEQQIKQAQLQKLQQEAEDEFNPLGKAQRLATTYRSLKNTSQPVNQYSDNFPDYLKTEQPQTPSVPDSLEAILYKKFAGIPDTPQEAVAAAKLKKDIEFADFARREGLKFNNQSQLEKYKQAFELNKLGIQAKNARDLEQYKAFLKGQDELSGSLKLTETTKTHLQKQAIGIDNVLPLLEKIKSNKFTLSIPSDPANFNRDVKTLVDSYISAKSLPNTNESINLIRDIFSKKWYESPTHYQKRIGEEIASLYDFRDKIVDTLSSNKIKEKLDTDKKPDIISPPKGAEIVKPVRGPDGRWRIQ